MLKKYIKETAKYLFKPDIVMPGGDQLDVESRMLVLAPRLDGAGLKIEQNSGTSYATPLAANIAAKIIRKYPNLNMQSVKALIINSAEPINSHYLDDTINGLRFFLFFHSMSFDKIFLFISTFICTSICCKDTFFRTNNHYGHTFFRTSQLCFSFCC